MRVINLYIFFDKLHNLNSVISHLLKIYMLTKCNAALWNTLYKACASIQIGRFTMQSCLQTFFIGLSKIVNHYVPPKNRFKGVIVSMRLNYAPNNVAPTCDVITGTPRIALTLKTVRVRQ